MDLVSIIIPFYNVENYIRICLDSLRLQTYREIEIILVNDGSTDNSRSIAEEFCLSDRRFILIDQANSGLSAARNTGLRHMSGEYVIFIDSDDWVEKTLVEFLIENIKEYKSDLACCRLDFYNEKKNRFYTYGKKFQKTTLDGEEILLDTLLVRNIQTSVCPKIYKTSFLKAHHLSFKEGIVNEDTLFTLLVALYAQRVSFINQILYHSLEREGSISRSSYKRLFIDMDKALEEVRKKMYDENLFMNKVEAFYFARYLKSMLYNLLQAAQRLPYSNYSEAYDVCIKHTRFSEFYRWGGYLPIQHRIMIFVSRSKFLFYMTLKVLNFCGFYMH